MENSVHLKVIVPDLSSFFQGSRSYRCDPSGCFLFMISSSVEKWGMRQLTCSLPLLLGTVKFIHQTADFTPASPVSVSAKPKHFPSRQLLCKEFPTGALTGASAPVMCDCWSITKQLLSNSVSRFNHWTKSGFITPVLRIVHFVVYWGLMPL